MRFLFTLILWSSASSAHHYKGLPHYSYFDNYPQVPILEFIAERPDYEMFVTIYNFQGLDLEMVNSPQDVRFYAYFFDVGNNRIYRGKVDFRITSHGDEIFVSKDRDPEQENIYVLQLKIKEQDDLVLQASFLGSKGEQVKINLPIQITETFFQKYGVYLIITLFFMVVTSPCHP